MMTMGQETEKIMVRKLGRALEERKELAVAQVENVNIYVTSYSGEYPAHKHPKDEFFLVLEGELQLGFGDRTVQLAEGEGLMVRKGTTHKPYAKDRALVLKVEPQDFPFEIV